VPASTPETCTVAANTLSAGSTYTFEFLVNDSASAPESQTSAASAAVAVSSALTAPAAPAVSATALDVNQALAVTGTVPSTGTSSYSWQWLVSVNTGAYATTTLCTVSSGTGASGGAVETCSVPASTLTVGNSYAFELRVTDSATVAETQTSTGSSPVVVGSALTAAATPTVSAAKLDTDQTLTVSGTIPSTGTGPYQYEWLFSTGGAYAKATMCATPSGSGVIASTPETCSIAANSLTAGSTYTFELLVNDSASTPETATSAASSGVAVNSALTSPAAPTVSAAKLDVDQALTVSGTLPSTGTSTYAWQWLVSVDSGAYGSTTQCTTNGGGGAIGGAGETCSIASGASPRGTPTLSSSR